MSFQQVLHLLTVVVLCWVAPASFVASAANADQVPQVPGYAFIGCRPSPGECMNSCPTRGGIVAKKDAETCERIGDFYETFLCYCRVDATALGADLE